MSNLSKRILPKKDFALIRAKLNSTDTKIAKTGIQSYISHIENCQNLPGAAIIERADLRASIVSCLQSNDYDLRKWCYHLLCLKPMFFDEELCRICLENVYIELAAENIENVSWILAVLSANITDDRILRKELNNTVFEEVLTPLQISISSFCYRLMPIGGISRERDRFSSDVIKQIIESDDSLSAIWVTKMFSNQFVKLLKANNYANTHATIDTNLFSQLLYNDDSVVRKYTMWAFAQDSTGGMEMVVPFLPYEKLGRFDAGVKKWYYVKMFQDLDYIQNNPDIIQDIRSRMRTFPPSVREGIIIGISKASYDPCVADLIIDWEQNALQEPKSICIPVYQYIAENWKKNEDFREIMMAAISNKDTSKILADANLLNGIAFDIKEGKGVNIQSITNHGNLQINESGNNYQSIYQSADHNEVVLRIIEEVQKKIDAGCELTDKNFSVLIPHLEFELHEHDSEKHDDGYRKISDQIKALKDAKKKHRLDRVKDILSNAANIVTFATAAPQIIDLVTKIVSHISNIFG